MKKRLELAAITCVAIVGTWLVGQGLLRAEEEEQQVRVQVRVDASEDGDDSAAGTAIKKRVIAVAVQAHGDLDKKVAEILKEAGLEGDSLKTAIDSVLKACKESYGAGAHTVRQFEMPQVTIVGPDGKQQKIELRSLGGGIAAGGATNRELTEEIRTKVEEALKNSGLDDKQLEQVRKAMERVGQIRMPQIQMLQPHAFQVETQRILSDNKYMIGLSCAPLNDALRSELKLADGQGLVVVKAFEGTPAEEAGVKDGDVLVKVNGKSVADIQDLISAVQTAGEGKKKLAVQLIRDGKKQTVQVAPAERDTLEISVETDIEVDEDALKNLRDHLPGTAKNGVFLWKQGPAGIGELGPGVITAFGSAKADDQAVKDLKKQVETLNRQVKQLQSELKKLKADKD